MAHSSATHKVLPPAPSSLIDGWQSPSKQIYFCWGLMGCMALKILRCCDNASSPEQRRVWGTFPSQPPPKNYIRLLRGLSHEAQCLVWGARGPFLPGTAMVRQWLCVFCGCVPEHEPYFSVEPVHIGYHQKALVLSKTILALYAVLRQRLRDKRKKKIIGKTNIYSLPRNANYLRKTCVVIMPRCCVCPNF
jgi:hypothetical protein